ncbi:mitochondrial 37S ribosomal protein uS13m [Kockiozyma suomiensis]|uniref:mitochondrial 37S ribosomal protein uS13m n=1 Tax=Kockiozyma suomiensis TaxID=1337062 RepID=UPI0033437B1A
MPIRFEGKNVRGNALIRIMLENKFPGLGRLNAERVCAKLGFYPRMRVHQLEEPDFLALSKELQSYTTGDSYVNMIRENIRKKRAIGTYAGRRHALGYPVKGQRTKNNGATARRHNRAFWEPRRFSTFRVVDAPSVLGIWSTQAIIRIGFMVQKYKFW